MTRTRTTNQKARAFVQDHQPFQNSNGQLYGEYVNGLYVVFSYGPHWPLFIHDGEQWFENEDRYSVTTSRHTSYAHPHEPTTYMDCDQMRRIVERGGVRSAA